MRTLIQRSSRYYPIYEDFIAGRMRANAMNIIHPKAKTSASYQENMFGE